MTNRERILARFVELENEGKRMPIQSSNEFGSFVDGASWQKWATTVLNLLKTTMGERSPHYENFKHRYDTFDWYHSSFQGAYGIFSAAKADFEGGHAVSLETQISGEIFGEFLSVAKEALAQNNKDVAAVVACAALEDVLKRYSKLNSLLVEGKTMDEVVNALKSKGLVTGAQKALLGVMPKIRNYAMHAEWDKITPQDVGSVIGFVEQLLIQHFS